MSLDKMTSESNLYVKLGSQKFENLYESRVALFVFKNKTEFGLQKVVSYTRAKEGVFASYHHWRKCHSRMQLGYRGCEIFNELPSECRNSLSLASFKRAVVGGFGLI